MRKVMLDDLITNYLKGEVRRRFFDALRLYDVGRRSWPKAVAGIWIAGENTPLMIGTASGLIDADDYPSYYVLLKCGRRSSSGYLIFCTADTTTRAFPDLRQAMFWFQVWHSTYNLGPVPECPPV